MRAWLYIITTGIIFSIGGPTTKYLIDQGLDPIFLTGLIFAVTAVASAPIHRRAGGASARAWRWALGLGALNASGPAILFNLGFQRLPVSINTVLISLGPIFTVLTAHFFSTSERFTTLKALGLSMSVVGVALLTGFSPGGFDSATGIALSVGGAALQGTSLWLVKRMSLVYRPATTLTPMMIGAALLGGITILGAGVWERPEAGQWAVIVALGVSGVLAFGAILAANEIAPASQTALFGYLIPLIGVSIGVLFFDEPFGPALALGGLLVIGGVVVVGKQGRREMPIAVPINR